jgi:hypothetical protein
MSQAIIWLNYTHTHTHTECESLHTSNLVKDKKIIVKPCLF